MGPAQCAPAGGESETQHPHTAALSSSSILWRKGCIENRECFNKEKKKRKC